MSTTLVLYSGPLLSLVTLQTSSDVFLLVRRSASTSASTELEGKTSHLKSL